MKSPAPSWAFAHDTAYRTLLDCLGTTSLDGFGCEGSPAAIAAAGGLVHYLRETQKADLRHLTRIVLEQASDSMTLDPTTCRTLEITGNARDGGRDGTVLEILDQTRTALRRSMPATWRAGRRRCGGEDGRGSCARKG